MRLREEICTCFKCLQCHISVGIAATVSHQIATYMVQESPADHSMWLKIQLVYKPVVCACNTGTCSDDYVCSSVAFSHIHPAIILAASYPLERCRGLPQAQLDFGKPV